MTYGPDVAVAPNPTVISPFSPLSCGYEIAGDQPSPPVSAAWSLAKRVVYVPFYLQRPFIGVKMFTLNGATAAGNVDIGVYSATSSNLPGTKLVAMGSTAQSGTNAIQVYDITDTTFLAGAYFLALTLDGTTGTIFRTGFTLTTILRTMACYQEATGTFGLPTTATPATVSSNTMPVFGLTSTVTV